VNIGVFYIIKLLSICCFTIASLYVLKLDIIEKKLGFVFPICLMIIFFIFGCLSMFDAVFEVKEIINKK